MGWGVEDRWRPPGGRYTHPVTRHALATSVIGELYDKTVRITGHTYQDQKENENLNPLRAGTTDKHIKQVIPGSNGVPYKYLQFRSEFNTEALKHTALI